MRPIRQSKKLQNVRYDVRGPILQEAQRLEAEGRNDQAGAKLKQAVEKVKDAFKS